MAVDDDDDTEIYRLLPADPAIRSVARDLYDAISDAPIISAHGHVPVEILDRNEPFVDAASLFITPDHYVTRLLHAEGVPLESLGIGAAANPRDIWARFSEHWPAFAGTASGYWLREEFRTVFGLSWPPADDAGADAAFDLVARALATRDFLPRALFERFGIEVLATTDDPLADLSPHARLRDDTTFHGRVIPTFRPDAYTDARRQDFPVQIERLLATTGGVGFRGYRDALRTHRQRFIEHRATSVDISTLSPMTAAVEPADAEALFDRVRRGGASTEDAELFDAVMILEHARMSVDDGLVLTLHPGSMRNHHPETQRRFGPDTGHDIPVSVDFTRALRPLLTELGTADGFHLVLYTLDETAYSRELAPLAGFYPSVFLGSPWWFLDAPYALARFRAATIETAGFRRYAGFVDDTRAFCSIPTRHDVARRVDAGVIARLVVEGRMTKAEGVATIRYSVEEAPRRVFKL